jgi:hypothetical protein
MIAAGSLLFTQPALASTCVPGSQSECACLSGGNGVQVCLEDGSRFGPCWNCAATEELGTRATPMVPFAPSSPGLRDPVLRGSRKKSPGMWAAGIALLAVGSVGIAAGVAVITGGAVTEGCDDTDGEPACIGGSIAIHISTVFVGVGIPLLVVGGSRSDDRSEDARRPWWRPTIIGASPMGGRLGWTF